MTIFDPRLWLTVALALALAFAAGFYKGDTHGKELVRAEWTAATAQANAEARTLEQRRQRRADEAAGLAATREVGIRADADRARRAAGGLRNDLDAIQRASADSLATATNAVRALGNVFEQCSAEYQRVAEAADRATSEAVTLRQAWPQ